MSNSVLKLTAGLFRWRRVRSGAALRLFLSMLITLASTASALPVRAAWEAEAGLDQAEEELTGEAWNAGCHRSAQRPRNRATAVATLSPAYFSPSTASFRDLRDHSPAGHLLPNGLRAPLRC